MTVLVYALFWLWFAFHLAIRGPVGLFSYRLTDMQVNMRLTRYLIIEQGTAKLRLDSENHVGCWMYLQHFG